MVQQASNSTQENKPDIVRKQETGGSHSQTDTSHSLAPSQSGSRPSTLASVAPWPSPFGLMRVLMEDLDRMLGGFGPSPMIGNSESGRSGSSRDLPLVPPVEVIERNGELVIRADLPGTNKDQIEIEIDDNQLVITAERLEERDERESNYLHRERRYGRFQRAFALPAGVQADQATAEFRDGVLEIRMPAPRRAKPRSLQISGGSDNGQTGKAEHSATAAH